MTAQRITKEAQMSRLQKITLFLLVLTGMDFFTQYRAIAIVACFLFLICKVSFRVDTSFLWLMILAVFWAIFSPTADSLTYVLAPFLYPLAYCVGYNFLHTDDQEKSENQLRMAMIVVSIGPFVHFMLNFIYNLDMGKDIDRNTYDFWTKDVLSATGQATLALMMLTVAVTMLFTNTRTRNKVLSIAVLATIVLYNLTLAGRTLFVMIMLVFAINLLFLVFKGEAKSKKYKTLLIIVLIILMLTILYNANAFGVQDAFESSNFYDRFFGETAQELNEDSRMDRKKNYLENFGESLWGGVHLRPLYGHAHDILLDTYDEAGIIALIAMFAFLVSAVVCVFKCITNKAIKFETRQWILSMHMAIFAQFMVEPILQGMQWLFILFCFIHGMTAKLKRVSWNKMLDTSNG